MYNFDRHRFYKLDEINLDRMDPLYYLGTIAAIPNLWKKIIKHYDFNEPIDYKTKKEKIFSATNYTKSIYWEQIDKNYPITQGWKTIWEKELDTTINDDQSKNIFVQFRQLVKPTKLQYFQYKILTRKLMTNMLQHKWDPSISRKCAMCQKEDETIIHIMYQCDLVKPLWELLQKACKHFSGLKINFNLSMIILNDYNGQQKALVNLLIAVMKQHIYAEKCKLNSPTFQKFMTKLTQYYQSDKRIAIENDRWKDFYKKWVNWF